MNSSCPRTRTKNHGSLIGIVNFILVHPIDPSLSRNEKSAIYKRYISDMSYALCGGRTISQIQNSMREELTEDDLLMCSKMLQIIWRRAIVAQLDRFGWKIAE